MGEILQGDVLEQLATLPDESVHMVMTSPPYWGLRDYQVGGQLGLEKTPEEYIEKMVAVFREVRRVLRKDGTLWLNMGDSYAGSGKEIGSDHGKSVVDDAGYGKRAPLPLNLKPKDLVGMPWRLALALQADGWWLRSDIIWAKPNPIPESVTDRPTSAHEHVFLLTKAARYFYDAEAVREPSITGDMRRPYGSEGAWQMDGRPPEQRHGGKPRKAGRDNAIDHPRTPNPKKKQDALGNPTHVGFNDRYRDNPITGRNQRDVWTIATQPLKSVVSYGKYRIGRPDCSVHGCPACLALALQGGELQVASEPVRSLGIDDDPVQGQEGVAYAISEDQYGFLSDVTAAISHSNQIHKTVAWLEQDGFSVDKLIHHIGCRESIDHSFAISAHTHENNTEPGSVFDVTEIDPSGQTGGHILGIPSFGFPLDKCTCEFKGSVEKRQDHFAAFPEALVKRIILAGTSAKGCCHECGAPWERVVEKEFVAQDDVSPERGKRNAAGNKSMDHRKDGDTPRGTNEVITTGWRPTCEHEGEPVPATVLDPFIGSGTVGKVAQDLGREWIGIELNPDYCDLARKRTANPQEVLRLC